MSESLRIPKPNPCRCCMSERCCVKNLISEYVWMGKREVYTEMLSETFNITIKETSEMDNMTICDPCITRLRDAAEFKKQVEECQEMLVQPLQLVSKFMDDDEVIDDVKIMKSETDDDCFYEDVTYITIGDEQDLEIDCKSDTILSELPKETSEKSLLYDLLTSADSVKKEKTEVTVPSTRQHTSSTNKIRKENFDCLVNNSSTLLSKIIPKTSKPNLLKRQNTVLASTLKPTSAPTNISRLTPSKSHKVANYRKATKDSTNTNKTSSRLVKDDKESSKKVAAPSTLPDKLNAMMIIEHTTAYPFRLPSTSMMCSFCWTCFDLPSQFRLHMADRHKKFEVAVAFQNLGYYNIKVDLTDLRCRLCSQTLDTLLDALKHLSTQHDISHINLDAEIRLLPFKFPQDKFNCSICDQTLPGLFELSRHTNSHYEKYPCEICGKCYSTAASRNVHVTYSHCNGTIMCRKCKKQFPDSESKNQHIHLNKKCWPYACVKCPERFVTYRRKKKHMEIAHSVTKSVGCSECDLTFDSGTKRNRHFRLAHTGGKFPCCRCSMKFDSKTEIDSHMVVHTKEALMSCKFCSKLFSREKSLKQHMWIHMEEKRFECKPCNKKFNQRISWKTHMKSYHPEVDIGTKS